MKPIVGLRVTVTIKSETFFLNSCFFRVCVCVRFCRSLCLFVVHRMQLNVESEIIFDYFVIDSFLWMCVYGDKRKPKKKIFFLMEPKHLLLCFGLLLSIFILGPILSFFSSLFVYITIGFFFSFHPIFSFLLFI